MITVLIKGIINSGGPIARVWVLLLLIATVEVSATQLDDYIQKGINNNIVLQQKNIQLDKAMFALRSANSLFLPNVSLLAGYQHGKGGRSIDLPVGDLMNPVYSTLNQLTGTNAFPQIENVETYFFPQNFYDAKVRTSVALLNSDLIYNRQIQTQQVQLQETEVNLYKRELVKNIKQAYYQYLSALKAMSIYDNAIVLAHENKRVNESLLSNGKGLPAHVIRSQSEIESLQAQHSKAKFQAENARMYFNFMINEDLNAAVIADYSTTEELKKVQELMTVTVSVENRQELQLLRKSESIHKTMITMNKRYWLPKLSGFLDLGSQASNFDINSKSQYYFVGVQLEAPLFAGRRNTFKNRMSELDLKSTELNTIRTQQQLQMSAGVAKNNVITSYEVYTSSLRVQETAGTYQKLVDKGYREGVYSFIEQIDATNQVTSAAVQANINELQVLIAIANYENEINK